MRFHDFCTRNSNHLILFIKNSYAHKIRTKDGGGNIEVVFTIREINYLVVSLFYDLAGPLLYIGGILLFGCAICLFPA